VSIVMNVALAKSTTGQPFNELFAAARGRLPGAGTVAELRQAAFDDFARLGLPYRRIEEWKYTDLRALLREVAPLAPAPDQAALARAAKAVRSLGIDGTQKLVLVDGVFTPQLSDMASLEGGVRVRVLREILEDAANEARADLLRTSVASDAMISLNAALATDGVVIDIAEGVVPAKPIHIVHVATHSDASLVTRSLVKVERGARVSLVESFVAAEGAKAYQTHDSIVIWIGDGAELQHVRLMEDALDAANISTAVFTIGAKARLNTFNLTNGGSVSRYQGFITFAGEGSELTTNGVNLLGARRHGDTTLVVDHAVPNCTSREVFRAVLDDRAHSVFQGRIIVRPDAQKTDGKMMTRALLLSDEAEADNKPELEIFADDVTCGHGATAGALDESLLFYLRARGLPEKEAQSLLIAAFVGEAIESIADDNLRDFAVAAAERWLATRG
jgi:Fe-S cluster assembly protein SufD